MSVEEAALQVSQSDIEFVVFRNERSEEVNVLYRRKDGSLGLIEPER
jgi:putative sigma-54 modulation protein